MAENYCPAFLEVERSMFSEATLGNLRFCNVEFSITEQGGGGLMEASWSSLDLWKTRSRNGGSLTYRSREVDYYSSNKLIFFLSFLNLGQFTCIVQVSLIQEPSESPHHYYV